MALTHSSTLGSGIYDPRDAAYLLGMDERTIVRWSTPTDDGRSALVAPSHGWAFSFVDLLSLAVIAVLRQRRISPKGVRRTLTYLENEFSTARPFAHKDVVRALRTVGGSVLLADIDVTKGGQLAIVSTIDAYLRPVEYGANRLARLWKPAQYVVLNPGIQAGRPCVAGTRVTTDVVASRLGQGESLRTIAHDLGITSRQANAARAFESRLQSGQGLALVA